MQVRGGAFRRGGIIIGVAAVVGAGFLGAQVLGQSGRGGSPRGGPASPPGGKGQIQVPTTAADFFQPGTQPDPTGKAMVPIFSSMNCVICHGDYLWQEWEAYAEPYNGWVNSMMGQSARDPIWHAALAIANQDAAGSGEFCIRCHAPGAWLAGRSTTGDLSQFEPQDFDGVNCHFCHRMVSPVLTKDSPVEDPPILAALDYPPGGHWGNAMFVIDPVSSRRGPFDDVPMNLHGPNDPIIYSPFHLESAMCGACHDVSNPVFERQPDGTYALAPLGEPHPTMNPHQMMPEQRTYSEWLHSQFAKGGVHFPDGRFGGNHPTGVMQSCQDCHMPKKFTGGCAFWEWEPFFPRPDMPQHHFAGANTWVLDAVFTVYGYESGLNEESIAAAHERTADMLRNAADLAVALEDDQIRVRVTNWSGHKLPTGYPEGRRMWLNVKFFDSKGNVIQEHGAYDYETATLTTNNTKVYEAHFGIGEDVAQATNMPAGKSFHLVLNNELLFDNRIPPVGFTNEAFDSVRARPVNYGYADGQHWDDTHYPVPPGAASAVATLYYQTTSREYIEFLRDQNTTTLDGVRAYELWELHGKSAPLDMNSAKIKIAQPIVGDLNNDGCVDVLDLLILLGSWGPCGKAPCAADLNSSGAVDVQDLLILLSNWGC
ncbi:MAG TPA: hypothetical protein PK400_08950 [Phycisphaerales bacterium]|nr:hypothetical protein [Phycisphaerales bacterium]